MSIKSDRWIRRMAAGQRMIDPFSPEQVRVAEGHKIISYGTSSYGYDVRCADEFKIFTNINSTIVDPKSFDEKSFVDFKGPVCIIPPNSFALASTVEYFRIPRSVLTVCLGKCVTGDTRVVDAETGAYVPITEMRWGKSTLALDSRRLKPAKVSAFVPQGRREVFELRTRAGSRIRATVNHPFLSPQGWVPLSELRPGDCIAAARNVPVFGKTPMPDREASLLGLTMAGGRNDSARNDPTSTWTDPAVARLSHACAAGAHGQDAGADTSFVPQSVFMAPEASVRLFLQALLSGKEIAAPSKGGLSLEFDFMSRRLIEDVHHLLLRFGVFSLMREKTTANGERAWQVQIAGKDQVRRFAERIGFIPGSLKQQRLDEEVLIRAASSTRTALHRGAVLAAAAGDRDVDPADDGPVWDVVEHIESAGTEEVFDISVPSLHNFLANDLIVHNSTYARCGIIVNVTPLEPEWEGHVTLEFSNTTPLPAKIYANEGVAQMLFFESDEVCETSYRDRGGKYQGQRGVTLPKA